MRELVNLIGYEYKKIFQRRSTWIALMVVLVLTLFGGFGTLLGDVYVEGVKAESYYTIMKKERKALEKMEGEKLNQLFFEKVQKKAEEIYKDKSNPFQEDGSWTAEGWKQYCKFDIPYGHISDLCTVMEKDISTIKEEDFYKERTKFLKDNYKGEGLTDGEIQFHIKENQQIETPFSYGNMHGFDRYFTLQYMTGMFLAFAIAICLAPMFAGEYTSNMDSLVLSSRFGKNKLIWAKLITGVSFSVLCAIFIFGISILEIGNIYGLSGWKLPIQVSYTGFYLSLPVHMLEMLGIGVGCGILATGMIAAVVMFCSAKMKSSFGVIIISFIFIFVPVLCINAVIGIRFLYLFVSSMPTSMMYPWGTVADQLLHIGDHYFYLFQIIPILYILLILGLALWSYHSFKNHQIA